RPLGRAVVCLIRARVAFRFLLGRCSADPRLSTELGFERGQHLRTLLEIPSRVVAALTDALAFRAVPGSRLFDQPRLDAEIEQVAAPADALAEEDVELADAERRSQLVFHDLHPRAVPD